MTATTDPKGLIGKRVVVTEGAHKGLRFNCASFENGLYWTDLHDEAIGFRPEQLRQIGRFRRLIRKLLGRKP